MENAHASITSTHLQRKAVLYIRQSTMHQVIENAESARRQYGLEERLVSLGWPSDRIEVVDCDQGLSGAYSSNRTGFMQMLTDVGNGEVGVVACIECSRLTRKTHDWAYLMELCSITHTLLVDEDGIYDPAEFNDSLLLGLKGTMSAVELHYIFSRMRGGALSMASRGEYRVPLPTGYEYDEDGNVQKDPDLRVQNAIHALFSEFRACGTARQLVRNYSQNGILFPSDTGNGFHSREVDWVALTYSRAYMVLKNPVYAGIYAYGRKQVERTVGGKKMRDRQPSEWHACIQGHHEGYISVEDFERNKAALAANRTGKSHGAALEGAALLQGIAVCGKCGGHLSPSYRSRASGHSHHYVCRQSGRDPEDRKCQYIHGGVVDQAVAAAILDTLTPIAIMKALDVQGEIERRVADIERLYAARVTEARRKADLAALRYNSADPENRLVTQELERCWNVRLQELALAEDEQRRSLAERERPQAHEAGDLLALPGDVERMWNSPDTTMGDRKRIVRCLVRDVTLLKEDGRIHVGIWLKTGSAIELEVDTPPWPVNMSSRNPPLR